MKTKLSMTPAERQAKRKKAIEEKGGLIVKVALTRKAVIQLETLRLKLEMNKTDIINKLLEESEQLKLL